MPRRLLRVEPLAVLQRLIELPDDRLAVADERDLGRLVLVHRLRLDVELDHPHVLVVPRRQAEMHDPVEPRAHQEHDVGLLQRQAAGRANGQRMVVGHHALAHRRGEERQAGPLDERAHLILGVREGHALADDHQRTLRRLQHVQRLLDILRHGLDARRIRAARGLVRLRRVAFAGDDVVRDIEIDRARPAINRLPHRHLHVERDAVHVSMACAHLDTGVAAST